MKAKDIMVTDVLTVGADWSLGQLAEFLVENSISGAPVVTSQTKKLIGVVSLTDLVRYEGVSAIEPRPTDSHAYYLDSLEVTSVDDNIEEWKMKLGDEATVREIMTPIVFQVDEEATARQVAEAMIDRDIHRVIVTKEGKAVGIITALDMLRVVRDHCF